MRKLRGYSQISTMFISSFSGAVWVRLVQRWVSIFLPCSEVITSQTISRDSTEAEPWRLRKTVSAVASSMDISRGAEMGGAM